MVHEIFTELVERVAACRVCPRMDGRTRVLGSANGDIRSKVIFVAEAPGRYGADTHGIPLDGDQTGRNFQSLLDAAGIGRDEVFITNAVLCNPRDPSGNNASPTRREIGNCARHLRDTIELIQPRYVVTLGVVALRSLQIIEPHNIQLARDVGGSFPWYSRQLVPLYHPGPRARIFRPASMQHEDFGKLAALLNGGVTLSL